MSEIIQKLGFDAGQAIQELQRLDGTMQRFENRLGQSTRAFGAFNKAGQGITQAGAAFKSQVPAMVAQTQRLTTSLGLLSRIVFTQAIVRGLSTLRNAFKATAGEAADFQAVIARITTINDGGQSFSQLGDAVRKLSDDFNIPLLEAAEGLYQSISNQIGDAGESLKFTATAAKLARATNSSLTDSVDLLSGALKSYNLDASQADRISSVFFKTIDLGRVQAGELANSFGRVGSIAADLGLSLEEVTGALAAITIRGSKTSEALTQVRAITSALLKPSEAMAKTLQGLGFASGESAIKTLGLAGTLKALADSTGGSAAQMAALFPNVRGLSGASSLLGDDLRSVSSAIAEMTAVGRGFANEKFLQATATDAEVVRASINRLSNAFVVNLGQGLLSASKQAIDFTGGTDTLVTVIERGTPVIIGFGAAVAALGVQLGTAKLAGVGLSRALGALAAVPLAIGAGESIGNSLNEQVNANRNKGLKALEVANAAELQSFTQTQQQKTEVANAANKRIIDNARQASQALNKAFSPDQIAATLDSESAVTALEGIVKREITTMDQLSAAMESVANKAAELRRAIDAAAVAGQQLQAVRGEVDGAIDSVAGKGGGFGGEFADGLRAQLAALKIELTALAASSNITEEQLTEVIAKRNEFGKAALEGENSAVGKLGFAADINQLDVALTKLQQLKSLQAQAVVDPGLQASLFQLQTVLSQNPAGQFGQAAASMSAAVGPVQAIASGWERAAAAAERAARAAAAASAGSSSNQAFGGMMHLAAGGSATRGIDTIPAMLSPGEFVMNARSSRKFYSQLQAMNAGQQPTYRENGGSVTNVGDVHVAVNGGSTATQTIREIGRGLHREIRRGTLKL